MFKKKKKVETKIIEVTMDVDKFEQQNYVNWYNKFVFDKKYLKQMNDRTYG